MEFSSVPSSQPEPAREPSHPPTGNEAFHQFLRGRDRTELEAMLRCVQTRLGTPSERAEDMENAQAIAHQLNNLRTCEGLEEDLDSIGAS